MSILDPQFPVDLQSIADSYQSAIDIIHGAEIQTVNVTAIWEKVYRIRKYIQAQAAAEFAEVLK